MDELSIKTEGLTKNFGDLVAVDGISFSVKKGEIFGFLGPNGAGKTTTIRMLCTLTRPTGGTAAVAGYDIVKEDNMVREHIGLVSEKMIMYDRLTAYENLKLFAKLYNIPKDRMGTKIDELLALVHMEKWRDAQIGTFSTGMKQRINVIRALLNEPRILFLDEPTLGLDPQSTAEIREFIRRINRDLGTTIILTTHMMTEADLLCDRLVIIDKSRIVALDTPANLKRMISGGEQMVTELEIPNLTNAMYDALAACKCVKAVTRETDTKVKVQGSGEGAFDAILDSVRSSGGKITSARNLEPTLEDVFLHITGRQVRDEANEKPKPRMGHGPRAMRGNNRVR